ncbi:hypothetical protein VT47_20140 [Pseudomonas syringae pv. syringae]|uniref:hypothetical protein n=1 Tax=Pseudomonas syringae TaxID=317 RepID=UPI0007AE8010|nr:hypothetical protein [Pseudomonas syringae]KZL37546.1 hypothetical protein VT47_20140 [Pseudomonas syringae pv. syringae]
MISVGLKAVKYSELPYFYKEFIEGCIKELKFDLLTDLWVVFVGDKIVGVFFDYETASAFMHKQIQKLKNNEALEEQSSAERTEMIIAKRDAMAQSPVKDPDELISHIKKINERSRLKQ